LPTESLQAMSSELKAYHAQGHFEQDPHARLLMLQIIRRIRKVYFVIQDISHIHDAFQKHTERALIDAADQSIHEVVKNSPSSALSAQKPFSWKLLVSNLNLHSPNFRYALRLSLAGLLGLLVPLALASIFSDKLLHSAFTQRSYWVLLTLVLVMKPGFALTRERNKRRLIGTLIGCAIAFILFKIECYGAADEGANKTSFIGTLIGCAIAFILFKIEPSNTVYYGAADEGANKTSFIGTLIGCAIVYGVAWHYAFCLLIIFM